ncbi:DUF1799 domain-containing protein [Comamonas odontotermitis]|uniref:DUF1799 domain-containing protein n=1 Tax=Comamonas odontotermitis TaxID=379895 RepID=UPI001CC3655F|nr:DUF1799 domain-containing protein [Comamonas odontotermitis]UBB16132.1 DUF1799 domain-containing protein [Comamonas odontotermitis]
MAEGCEPEDYWEDPVEVWPENWETLLLFVSMQTQWSIAVGVGGGGRTGMWYASLYPLLDRIAAGDQEEWDHLFAEMRALERVVLAIDVK